MPQNTIHCSRLAQALIRFVLELGLRSGLGTYSSRGALPFYAAVVCEYLAGLKQVGAEGGEWGPPQREGPCHAPCT